MLVILVEHIPSNRNLYILCLQYISLVNKNKMTTPIIARVDEPLANDIEFFSRLEKLDKSAVIRRLLARAVKEEKLELAMKGYMKKEISIGRAAEIAEIPLADMLKIASERNIHVNYSLESLEADFKASLNAK